MCNVSVCVMAFNVFSTFILLKGRICDFQKHLSLSAGMWGGEVWKVSVWFEEALIPKTKWRGLQCPMPLLFPFFKDHWYIGLGDSRYEIILGSQNKFQVLSIVAFLEGCIF